MFVPSAHTDSIAAARRLQRKWWGLLTAAVLLPGAVFAATYGLPNLQSSQAFRTQARTLSLVAGLTLLGVAKSRTRELETVLEANQLGGYVLSHNHAARLNLETQPLRVVESFTAAAAAELAGATLAPIFDFKSLSNGDKFPAVLVLGGQGSGKTRLVRYLANYFFDPDRAAAVVALDTFGRANEWGPETRVITEIDQIREAMTECLKLVNDRKRDYAAGRDDFPTQVWVLEEAPDTVAELGDDTAKTWVSKLTSVGRKVRVRLVLAGQFLTAEDLGISASKRDTTTQFFPGTVGIELAENDVSIFKLGAKQNAAVLASLKARVAQLTAEGHCHGDNSFAYVRHQGRWSVAVIPQLDTSGNPPGVRPSAPPQTPTHTAKREDALDVEFFEVGPQNSTQAQSWASRALPPGRSTVQEQARQNWSERAGVDYDTATICAVAFSRDRAKNPTGWITPSDLTSKNRGLKTVSSALVIELFGLLAEDGRGQVERTTQTTRFRANQ